MNKLLLILILFILNEPQFPEKGYDRVILYKIKMDEQSGVSGLFDAHGEINSSEGGIEILEKEVSRLLKIINDTTTYGAVHAYSHAPTIGIVFYNKSKITDWLEIALPANTIYARSKIRNQWRYYQYFIDDTEYPLKGLFPIGRNRLREWIRETGTKEPDYYHSVWDSTAIDYSALRKKF